MRVSAEESRKTHDRIVDMAAKMFLECGLGGVSVTDVMTAAGQTNGGFYKRFASKEDLTEQAVSRSFLRRPLTMRQPRSIDDFVDGYVSELHVSRYDEGCPLPALATDIARQNDSVKQRFQLGLEDMLSVISALLITEQCRSEADARPLAMNIISKMVGAIVIARALPDDTSLKDELLHVLRVGVRSEAGLEEA
jgi:TetR/AcrR family transcriptional repressor of nem operon